MDFQWISNGFPMVFQLCMVYMVLYGFLRILMDFNGF